MCKESLNILVDVINGKVWSPTKYLTRGIWQRSLSLGKVLAQLGHNITFALESGEDNTMFVTGNMTYRPGLPEPRDYDIFIAVRTEHITIPRHVPTWGLLASSMNADISHLSRILIFEPEDWIRHLPPGATDFHFYPSARSHYIPFLDPDDEPPIEYNDKDHRLIAFMTDPLFVDYEGLQWVVDEFYSNTGVEGRLLVHNNNFGRAEYIWHDDYIRMLNRTRYIINGGHNDIAIRVIQEAKALGCIAICAEPSPAQFEPIPSPDQQKRIMLDKLLWHHYNDSTSTSLQNMATYQHNIYLEELKRILKEDFR